MRNYDIVILGAGVAGAFAAYNLASSKEKICLIDFGRPPGKRRKQLEGWFGCFPASNSRLYLSDAEKVKNVAGVRRTQKAESLVMDLMKEFGPFKKEKNNTPNKDVMNLLNETGYSFSLNDYYQWLPDNVHSLSRHMADSIDEHINVEYLFDTEIFSMEQKDGGFLVHTENGEVFGKKVLLAIGRSGWRLSKDILNTMSALANDDYSEFGFRAELPVTFLKNWNKSHCSITKDNVSIGPLSWNGTVIPEDHVDLVLSSWRSNEDRWRTDKVSFSVLLKERFKGKGIAQTERLGKLAFVLSDSRVGKIRVKEYMTSKIDISLVPEYYWVKDSMESLDIVFPKFIDKAYFYIPNVTPTIPKIKLNKDLMTVVNGLYVAGESLGIPGILSAAISGTVAAVSLLK